MTATSQSNLVPNRHQLARDLAELLACSLTTKLGLLEGEFVDEDTGTVHTAVCSATEAVSAWLWDRDGIYDLEEAVFDLLHTQDPDRRPTAA